MIPVISIVGKSESGKTTLLEKLIPELKRRGYRLAAVKHTGEDFEMDQPCKDSWRLTQAGADMVAIGSDQKVALVKKTAGDVSLEDMVRYIGADYDLILTEGYKHGKAQKIEVYRSQLGSDLACPPEQLLALVTDRNLDGLATPQFATDDIKGLAAFIESRFLGKEADQITLYINDKRVPLNPFVREIIIKTIMGMVSALKGVGEVVRLDVWFRKNTRGY